MRIARDNSIPRFAGDNLGMTVDNPTGTRQVRQEEFLKFNSVLYYHTGETGPRVLLIENTIKGLNGDEDNGLMLEDRKRRRGEPGAFIIKEISGVVNEAGPQDNTTVNMEVSLSEMDCVASPQLLTAKLSQ